MEQENTQIEPKKIKLKDYGFKTAGLTGGKLVNFKSELDSIYQGKLVDESIKIGISEEEKLLIKDEIVSLNRKKIELANDYETKSSDISKFQNKINELNEEIAKIRRGEIVNTLELFNPLKFGIEMFIFIGITFYLAFFYVNVLYKALYFDSAGIAEKIANDESNIGAFPNFGEIINALSNNFLLIVVPFAFFGAGYLFHSFKENKKNIQAYFIILLIFIADCILAFKVHSNISEAMGMIGLTPEKWYKDTLFYIILFLGFAIFFIWSLLLISILNEWRKRDIITVRLREIDEIKNKTDEYLILMNQNKTEIQNLENEIASLEQKLISYKIPINDVIMSLSEFKLGWLQFLSAIQDYSKVAQECDSYYEEFVNSINN
jgi:prefoldin subunit 5